MKQKLSNIYAKSEADGVWARQTQASFAYSDGDEVENRIASIFQTVKDLSVLSPELRKHISDWPSKYHLSSQRANLLRPLASELSGSVLEIGSGCGAITRYLGETARSVLALEGSRRRAHITRLRTRDMPHVDVCCDEFSAFQTDAQVDAVTLIGVLEYANLFVGGDLPALHMLSTAKKRLNEGGCLIIAIENQLGLKYWAGAPEDHLGQAMRGLENSYTPGGVRTYGKQDLSRLLQQAGFNSVKFLYPFPDYKLPSCVLTDRALKTPSFDPVPFLVGTAGKDPQLPLEPGFCMERIWPVLAANGLVSDLSNSFLVVARIEATPEGKDEALAWHYSTQRLPGYCKETVFHESTDQEPVSISRHMLTKAGTNGAANSEVIHRAEDTTPYSPHPLLSSVLIDLVTSPGWTFQQMADFLLTYAKHVASIGNLPLVENEQIRWDVPIPGNLFDCVPQNISLLENGASRAFDLEWQLSTSISFTQLAFRSFWSVIWDLSVFGSHATEPRLSILDVITGALRFAGREVTSTDAQELIHKELEFQHVVAGVRPDFDGVLSWITSGQLRQDNAHQSLSLHKRMCVEIRSSIAHEQNIQRVHAASHQEVSLRLQNQIEEERHRFEQMRLAYEQMRLTHEKERLAHEKERLAREQMRHVYEQQCVVHDQVKLALLASSASIHRLTRQSASQYLLRRSAKNLLKQAIEQRQLIGRTQKSVGGVKSILTGLLQAVKHHWSPRATLLVLAEVKEAEQATHLMMQSCHWPIPFEWRFLAQKPSIEPGIAASADALGLTVKFTPTSQRSAPIGQLVATDGAPILLVAIPRLITPTPSIQLAEWPLPDAELVRQAYGAMHCDRRIAVIYVGATCLVPLTDTQERVQPVLCVIRPSFTALYDLNILISQRQLTKDALFSEISSMRASADGNGLLVLSL